MSSTVFVDSQSGNWGAANLVQGQRPGILLLMLKLHL